ncbi:polysaccharide deacetylase family protein [Pseudohalioglobus sediminis]|nr:polysaccharide deacetylase family protein [Pseudohalioglobus sediminis]
MKSLVLQCIYFAAFYAGILDLFYRRRKTPIVITYHNIIPDDLFDKNAQFIGGDHRVSEFDAHLSIVSSKVSIGNRCIPGEVLITFDDGYKNNKLVACPILKKHGASATFFIPACYFESSDILWVDTMLMWLSYVPDGDYDILEHNFALSNKASRSQAWEAIWERLLQDFSLKQRVLLEMEERYPVNALEIDDEYLRLRFSALNEDDLYAMIAEGNQLACHSYNHDILSRLPPADLQSNFEKCEPYRAKYNVNWFSYPFGRDDEVSSQVVELCKTHEYSKAFMNINRPSDDVHKIPRINMPNSTNRYLIHAKLSGFEGALKSALRLG